MLKSAGSFAENKDVARDLRTKKILPALKNNQQIVLDFKGVESTTQSFIHALISEAIRDYNHLALDLIEFKNCNDTIQTIIGIVVDYMQQSD